MATQTRYSDLAGQNKIGSSTFTYDSVGRLTNLQHLDGSGNNIANYVNAFDLASRITSETLNGGTPTNYTYDVTNELTDDNVIAYSYDLNGNRTMPGYTTGLANELTSDGIWNYFHDKNGNLVGKTNISTGETWSYGYDNRNRLISAIQTTSAGVQMQATYVYDALGQRIEKDVTQSGVTTTTRFAYDRREIWADLTSTNSLQTRYVRGEYLLELLARIASGTVAWILADRMGSVRDVVDNTGAVSDTITYDGYGNVESEMNPMNGGQYKYDGYRYDSETGWLRPDPSNGRYYETNTGRWLSADPLGFRGEDSNLFRYVANNPPNHFDPSGMKIYVFAFEGAGKAIGLSMDPITTVVKEAVEAGAKQAGQELEYNSYLWFAPTAAGKLEKTMANKKKGDKVILIGYSWGAQTVVELAMHCKIVMEPVKLKFDNKEYQVGWWPKTEGRNRRSARLPTGRKPPQR